MESQASVAPARGRIFISHAHASDGVATQLAEFLQQEGLKPWLARSQLIPGGRWEETVQSALEEASGVVLIVGPDPPSPSIRSEWSMVLESLWEDKEGKVLVPVILDDASVPPFLKGVESFHLSSDLAGDRQSLGRVVARLKRTADEVTQEQPVAAFDELHHRIEDAIGELERDESDEEVLRNNLDLLQNQLEVLKEASDLDPWTLMVSSRAIGMLNSALGDHASARNAFEQAIEAYEQSEGSEAGLAPVHNALGRSLMLLGDPQGATRQFEEGLRLQSSSNPDPPAMAATLHSLGTALCQSHEYDRAADVLAESLEISRKALGDLHPNVASTALMLGHALLESGNPEQATAIYEELLGTEQERSEQTVATMCLGLGKALRELGHLERSSELLEKSLDINEQIFGGDDFRVASVAYQLALTAGDLGDLARAVALLEHALRIYVERGDLSAIGRVAGTLGIALRRAGDFSGSVSRLEQALEAFQALDVKGLLADTYYQLALSLREEGNRARADECLEKAIELGRLIYGNDHPRVGKYERAAERMTRPQPLG